MKRKIALFLAAFLLMTGLAMQSAQAARLIISVGDQPYYTYGPGYWSGGAYYVWIPGHWAWHRHHRFWVHGHYALR
ncbi:MAG: hypothetical protein QOI04_2292 [Verrucomicrobiota bacterium]|jgi:hypothetical protein